MPSLEAIDQGAVPWFQLQRGRVPWLDAPLRGLALAGDWRVALGVAAAAAGLLAWRRRYRAAAIVAAAALAGLGLAAGTQLLVRRPTPQVTDPLVAPEPWSFPSMGVLVATAVYMTLVLILALPAGGARGRELIGAAAVLVLAIGFSRMYGGANYLSDVAGGWLAGLALAFAGRWAAERPAGRPPPASG